MSTYTLDELLRKWTQGGLSAEQAIGHILQHLKRLDEGQTDLDRRLVSAIAYVFPSGPEGSSPPPRRKQSGVDRTSSEPDLAQRRKGGDLPGF